MSVRKICTEYIVLFPYTIMNSKVQVRKKCKPVLYRQQGPATFPGITENSGVLAFS